MEFRKIKADQIFNGYQFISGNMVLVLDQQGTVQEIVEEDQAGSDKNNNESIHLDWK